MTLKRLRVYVETSVWNFHFADDAPPHRDATLRFFEQARDNRFELCISELVIRELQAAPEPRLSQLLGLLGEMSPTVFLIDEETSALADEFVNNHVVPAKYANDATHIAAAVVAWHLVARLAYAAPTAGLKGMVASAQGPFET